MFKRGKNYPFSRHTVFSRAVESRGKLTFQSPELPSKSGISWIAAPRDCIGLVYRVTNESVIEALEVVGDSISVVAEVQIYVPIVNIACSDDGRLIVVACCDGSVACYDVIPESGILPRWTVPHVHSHVAPNLAETPSEDQSYGGAPTGPIHSFSFAFSEYYFLIVDGGTQKLTVFDAAMSEPVDLLTLSNERLPVLAAISACWYPAELRGKGKEIPIAIGLADASIVIALFFKETMRIKSISHSPMPVHLRSTRKPFACTHLDWCNEGRTLVVGYTSVRSTTKKDIHDPVMYITNMNDTFDVVEWRRIWDVVPSQQTMEGGRYVFFTSFVQTQSKYVCLAVVSNLCKRMILLRDDGRDGWKVANLRAGRTANWDPHFSVGSLITQVPRDQDSIDILDQAFLVLTTDGTLIKYNLEHQKLGNFFTVGDNVTLVPVDRALGNRSIKKGSKRRLSLTRSNGARRLLKARFGRTSSSEDTDDGDASISSLSASGVESVTSSTDDEASVGISVDGSDVVNQEVDAIVAAAPEEKEAEGIQQLLSPLKEEEGEEPEITFNAADDKDVVDSSMESSVGGAHPNEDSQEGHDSSFLGGIEAQMILDPPGEASILSAGEPGIEEKVSSLLKEILKAGTTPLDIENENGDDFLEAGEVVPYDTSATNELIEEVNGVFPEVFMLTESTPDEASVETDSAPGGVSRTLSNTVVGAGDVAVEIEAAMLETQRALEQIEHGFLQSFDNESEVCSLGTDMMAEEVTNLDNIEAQIREDLDALEREDDATRYKHIFGESYSFRSIEYPESPDSDAKTQTKQLETPAATLKLPGGDDTQGSHTLNNMTDDEASTQREELTPDGLLVNDNRSNQHRIDLPTGSLEQTFDIPSWEENAPDLNSTGNSSDSSSPTSLPSPELTKTEVSSPASKVRSLGTGTWAEQSVDSPPQLWGLTTDLPEQPVPNDSGTKQPDSTARESGHRVTGDEDGQGMNDSNVELQYRTCPETREGVEFEEATSTFKDVGKAQAALRNNEASQAFEQPERRLTTISEEENHDNERMSATRTQPLCCESEPIIKELARSDRDVGIELSTVSQARTLSDAHQLYPSGDEFSTDGMSSNEDLADPEGVAKEAYNLLGEQSDDGVKASIVTAEVTLTKDSQLDLFETELASVGMMSTEDFADAEEVAEEVYKLLGEQKEGHDGVEPYNLTSEERRIDDCHLSRLGSEESAGSMMTTEDSDTFEEVSEQVYDLLGEQKENSGEVSSVDPMVTEDSAYAFEGVVKEVYDLLEEQKEYGREVEAKPEPEPSTLVTGGTPTGSAQFSPLRSESYSGGVMSNEVFAEAEEVTMVDEQKEADGEGKKHAVTTRGAPIDCSQLSLLEEFAVSKDDVKENNDLHGEQEKPDIENEEGTIRQRGTLCSRASRGAEGPEEFNLLSNDRVKIRKVSRQSGGLLTEAIGGVSLVTVADSQLEGEVTPIFEVSRANRAPVSFGDGGVRLMKDHQPINPGTDLEGNGFVIADSCRATDKTRVKPGDNKSCQRSQPVGSQSSSTVRRDINDKDRDVNSGLHGSSDLARDGVATEGATIYNGPLPHLPRELVTRAAPTITPPSKDVESNIDDSAEKINHGLESLCQTAAVATEVSLRGGVLSAAVGPADKLRGNSSRQRQLDLATVQSIRRDTNRAVTTSRASNNLSSIKSVTVPTVRSTGPKENGKKATCWWVVKSTILVLLLFEIVRHIETFRFRDYFMAPSTKSGEPESVGIQRRVFSVAGSGLKKATLAIGGTLTDDIHQGVAVSIVTDKQQNEADRHTLNLGSKSSQKAAEKQTFKEEEDRKRRLMEIVDSKRRQEEEEKRQLKEQAERKRQLREEAEKWRLREEFKKRQLHEEAEKRRLKEETEKRRHQEEARERRLREEETKKRRLEQETKRERTEEREDEKHGLKGDEKRLLQVKTVTPRAKEQRHVNEDEERVHLLHTAEFCWLKENEGQRKLQKKEERREGRDRTNPLLGVFSIQFETMDKAVMSKRDAAFDAELKTSLKATEAVSPVLKSFDGNEEDRMDEMEGGKIVAQMFKNTLSRFPHRLILFKVLEKVGFILIGSRVGLLWHLRLIFVH